MIDKVELKVYTAALSIVLFDVFFAGTSIVFSLINSNDVFLLLTGIVLVAFILFVNLIAVRYIVSQFEVKEIKKESE